MRQMLESERGAGGRIVCALLLLLVAVIAVIPGRMDPALGFVQAVSSSAPKKKKKGLARLVKNIKRQLKSPIVRGVLIAGATAVGMGAIASTVSKVSDNAAAAREQGRISEEEAAYANPSVPISGSAVETALKPEPPAFRIPILGGILRMLFGG